jgi:hypothetical protein
MSDPQERFHVRLEGTRPIRLTVAEMSPEDVRLAVASAERELQLMQEHAAAALALLGRVAARGQTRALRTPSGRKPDVRRPHPCPLERYIVEQPSCSSSALSSRT